MKTSQECIKMIKKFEGLRLTAYQCSANVFTIGYGHTGKDVSSGLQITAERADALLIKDLEQFEAAVNALVKVPLNQNQFDALVSWTYNLGSGNLAKSTLLEVLNAGKYDEVPVQMKRWTRSQGKVLLGLVNRRDEEAQLFATPIPASTMHCKLTSV